MSQPNFPVIDPPLTRDGSVNEIIASIAAEELSLSHILNAEGEKLQYVLGKLPFPDIVALQCVKRMEEPHGKAAAAQAAPGRQISVISNK